MTVYTVHLPQAGRPGSAEGLERAVLVKDGFHWLALFFPLLWLLFNRLWLPLLAFVAATALLIVAGALNWIPQQTVALLEIGLGALLALCAGDVKSWVLTRRGLPAVDVVAAPDEEAAERRFFERWMAGESSVAVPAPGPAAQSAMPGAGRDPQVLGLFPQPEGPR